MRKFAPLPKSILLVEILGMGLLTLAWLSLNQYVQLPAPIASPTAALVMLFAGIVLMIPAALVVMWRMAQIVAPQFTELLELPQHVLPLFGLCLGWPADNPDIKPRMPAAMLVHENRYQPLDNALLAEYDEQLAHYYLSRGSNARRDTWSDHIRRTIVKESRPFILDYLHKQGWATR